MPEDQGKQELLAPANPEMSAPEQQMSESWLRTFEKWL